MPVEDSDASTMTEGWATVADVMSADVVTVEAATDIEVAIGLLVRHRITGMPVVDARGRCVGILSESDVLARSGRCVSDLMTRAIIFVEEQTPIDDAFELLVRHGLRRLPVTRYGRLVGMVTRMDFLRFVAVTTWRCPVCGECQHALRQPDECDGCGSPGLRFERGPQWRAPRPLRPRLSLSRGGAATPQSEASVPQHPTPEHTDAGQHRHADNTPTHGDCGGGHGPTGEV